MSAEPSTASLFRTFLFTDIEGSTRLWEHEPARMRAALERHDELSRAAVRAAGGELVKTTGDGVHAAFEQPHAAVAAALALQQAMAAPVAEGQLALKVRCGVHCGECEARDGDYYGPVLNRAARVMGAAHGGQTLVTQAVAERAANHLPAGTTLLDLGTVRLRDLASPERVHQLLHPALRAQFPPLRSLEATPNNLTQQLNSFVGRERELAEVRQLLARTRLLTLLGMGGIGKSRLSVQLGAELLDEYPDGVWLVELAPLADPLLVPQALASVLGVKEERGAGVTEALLTYVRDKSLLVILDNCEHVVHACADLAKRLLQASPGVRMLTSSRDVLQVAGETVYQVPTLGVPAADEDGADTVPPVRTGGEGRAATVPRRPARPGLVNELGRHAAVQLFLDRAGAVQPSFRLDPDNAAAVASICRRLDGIPLALELAAARTRALSVQVIAERLKDRFRLLVSGDQTVLPRQRTLRALIDWSFELLSEPERTLFRRLAVFAGGWTLESAERVCAGEGLDEADVLDLLAQLVQKSLVVMEREGARYRMLETVRAYAAEKLADAGDEAAARRRHVSHYVDFADRMRGKLAGPEQAGGLAELDLERDNLLAAHAWCGTDAECLEPGLRLVFLLKIYWHARGLLSLGLRVTVEALGRTRPDQRDFLRCRALCDAGQLAYYMGRHVDARAFLEESHAIALELGNKERLSALLAPLGMLQATAGDHAQAIATFESAVAVSEELGHRRQAAVALNSLAQLHRASGNLPTAEALYQRVLGLLQELGDSESIAIALLNLAMLAITAGDDQPARSRLSRVLAIEREINSKPVYKSLLEVAAGFCATNNDPGGCAYLFGSAEEIGAKTGLQREREDDEFLRPLVERARCDLGSAGFEVQTAAGRRAPELEVRELLARVVRLAK
ncbi:MAG: tetratricopeptide repeat protein [Rubrivivax sp.]|nr:tetratricopeptide repeat protein [Rubrivivax sp.]